MTYTELSTVEKPIIRWLQEMGWEYISADNLRRSQEETFEYFRFKEALMRLNPFLNEKNAEMIISKLERLPNDITGNKELLKWVKGEKSVVLRQGEKAKTIKLIDYENIKNNEFVVTNQFRFSGYENVRFDIVLMINGIPVVIFEAKKPTGIYDYHEGIKQLLRYSKHAPQIFKFLAFVCATDGMSFKYGWTDEKEYFYWRTDYYDPLEGAIKEMFEKEQLLDIVNNFVVFEKIREEVKKKIGRYNQISAVNKITERVLKEELKNGLVWHTQGSGKTLTMLFAAWKLKKIKELKNPTILVVVDRIELESQLSGVFKNVELPYTAKAKSIKNLKEKLERDSREVIITTVHKFESIDILNKRENVIIFVDEAHRTQYGLLAASMRETLPNALIFGFTGTPIDKNPRNTFRVFCPAGEKYLDKYSIKQSILDGFTVPIYYLPRLASYHIDKDILDREFLKITAELTWEEQEEVLRKSVRLKEVIKGKDRIKKIAEDIAQHFKEYVEPDGFKAMLVAIDREACALYKEEIDKHLPKEWSEVIYTSAQNDTGLLRKYHKSKDEQLNIVKGSFQKTKEDPRILIVTDMLITGFDAPILQVMYLDKPMRDHKLLQAIARTNRPYIGKEGGIIADYIGIFDNLMKALNFEERDIEGVAFNFNELKEKFKNKLTELINLFNGIKRDDSRDSLFEAIKVLEDEKNLKSFKENFSLLKRLYEFIAPDPFVIKFKEDYSWLIAVNEAYNKYARKDQRDLQEYEEKTKMLVREKVGVYRVRTIPVLKIDRNYLKKLDELGYSEEQKIMEIKQAISYHIRINIERNPVYETLSQKLERILREKDGKILLESLKRLIEEINEIEDKARKLNISKREYALLEVLKKYSGIDEEEGAEFVKNLMKKIKPRLFHSWQEKKKVVQEIERVFFDECFNKFSGKIGNKKIVVVAEEMIEYLKRSD